MALMLGYGTLQNFYKVSMYLIILHLHVSINICMKSSLFFCMSAFIGVHQYNFDSRRQDEITE